MNIADLLDRGAIAPRATASTQRQSLTVIAEIAARNFGLKVGEILDALEEREAAGSTGVGYGVAVPHAHLPGLTRLRGIFVRLEPPGDFSAVHERPVDLLFAIFSPPKTTTQHLRTL